MLLNPAAPPRQSRPAEDEADSAFTAVSLATAEGRRRTFTQGGWDVSFLSPEKMAAAGFYSLQHGDSVRCFYCDVTVNSWRPGDDPLAEHLRFSPRCPFLDSRWRGAFDAVSYDNCSPFDTTPSQSRPQQPAPAPTPTATPVRAVKAAWPHYRTREARLASFKDWPPSIPVKPTALSEAGFFYSGSGDRTICYYCGRGLRDWEANDDPWVEHELWFPGCSHVALHRGNDFVRGIAEKRDAMIAAKHNPRDPAKPDSRETETDLPAAQSLEARPPEETPGDWGETAEEKSLCKICYEKEMGVVFLPCGHVVACVDCALSVTSCPVCRQPFQNTVRIYLP